MAHIITDKRWLPMPGFVKKYLQSLPKNSSRIIGDGPAPKDQEEQKAYFSRLANACCQQMLRSMREWNPDSSVAGKDLRNTLQTFAIENTDRVNTRLFDRFAGHAATGMMDKHYHGRVKDDMVEIYREKVIPLIDAQINTALIAREEYKMAKNSTEKNETLSGSLCNVVDFSELTG